MQRIVLALALCCFLAPVPSAAQDLTRQEMIQVQGLLSDMGYDLAVDGIMGPGTAAAIGLFQEESGLPVTGRPTPVLLGLLQALHAEGWYRTGGQRATTRGPSFDCGKASTLTERAICGDASLAFLDRELAAAYGAARSGRSSSARARLADEQRAWLFRRDQCAADVTCLRFAMEARIEQLR